MTATPTRRLGPALLALVALAALLAGCSGQRDPGSYTASVKRDFVSGCWTTTIFDENPDVKLQPSDSRDTREAKATKLGSAAQVKAAKSSCTCTFTAIKKKVKFGTFKSINENLREDGGGKLPSSITNAYKSCAQPDVVPKG